MKEIELQFSKITNPEECSIDELKTEIERLEGLVGFYDTKQLAIKKFINSVYGALGSKYFTAYNTAIAESITAQGRDLNHFSENSVNEYFDGIFQSNPKVILYYQWVYYKDNGETVTFESDEKPNDYYSRGKWEECQPWTKAVKKGKKLTPELKECLRDNSEGHCDWFMTQTTLFAKLKVDPERAKAFHITKGMTTQLPPLTEDVYEYLKNPYSLIVAGDTDSVSADTMIRVRDNSESADPERRELYDRIENLYTHLKYASGDTVLRALNDTYVVPVTKKFCVETYDQKLDKIVFRPIRYIMRHSVSKQQYKLTTASGKSVTVTEDHSCMVVRDGKLIEVKPYEIDKETDKIISIAPLKK